MRAAEQLPPGRHGLSRKEVARSQRDRILRSIADAVAEHGYVMTPVADVLRRAGVSRETFYEHFANKQECFLAAYDASADTLLASVREAARSAPPTAGVAERLERLTRLVDDAADRGFLVQAGQDDRDLHRRRKITALTAVEPNSIRAVPRSGTAAPLPRCADDLSPRAIAVRLFGDASR